MKSYVTTALLTSVIVIVIVIVTVGWFEFDPYNIQTKNWFLSKQVIEPFNRQFFFQPKPTKFFGLTKSQLHGNETEVIDIIKAVIPFKINTVLIERDIDRYHLLNQNRIHFVLSYSNELHYLLNSYKQLPVIPMTPSSSPSPSSFPSPSPFLSPSLPFVGRSDISQIRFVCTLFDIPVNILTTSLNLVEIEDLRGTGLTVNVGPKYSNEYFVAMTLFNEYHLVIDQDVILTYYDHQQLLEHYGNDVYVAFLTKTHPDLTISLLSKRKISKLIEILYYNDGNIYHVTLNEKPFYQRHPYFSKHIISKETLKQYYPYLVLNDHVTRRVSPSELVSNNRNNHGYMSKYQSYRSYYINTLSLKYYLLSNQQTPDQIVYQMLYFMKLNTNEFNRKEFIEPKINTSTLADYTLSMPLHPGAKEFYYHTGLITNISNPQCIMINGRCDQQQLELHHLVPTI